MTKFVKLVKLEEPKIGNGIAGLEAMEARLQQAMDALDDVAGCFDCLGLETQSEKLDSAQDKIQDVQDLLGVFLGKVDQVGAFDSLLSVKRAKPVKKPRGAHKALKRLKVAA